jgi:LEA14-like dessication related protein
MFTIAGMKALRAVAVSSIAVLCGCAFLKQMAASGFQKPSLAFKDATLSDITLAGATVNLVFTVTNPNDAALSLAETDYKLLIEGKQVVAGKPPAGIRIPANGTGEVTLPASLKFADVAGSIADFLRKEQANYSAEGHIGVDTPIGIAALPFQKEGTVPLPKLPDVSLGTPKIGEIGLTSARIDVPLVFNNKNAFALPLGSVSGALRIAGADVGEVGAQPVGRVDPRAAKTVTLPVTVHFSQAMAAARAIREGRAHVAVDGQLAAEGAAVPFHVEHDVEFAQGN